MANSHNTPLEIPAVHGVHCSFIVTAPVRRARSSAPGNGESVWDSALPTGCCSFPEHPLEDGRRPRIATSFVPLRWPVVGARDGVRRQVRVWHVPAPHEDHRLPRPDRQALRRARHDTELEHDRCHPANLEGPQQPAVTGTALSRMVLSTRMVLSVMAISQHRVPSG
jgi:hypothetical protein